MREKGTSWAGPSLKRKRGIKTEHVYKCKSRINIHISQQEYVRKYTETYSPVFRWFSITLLLILSVINQWQTIQVNFMLLYPQAPIEHGLYMKPPKEKKTKTGNGRMHVLHLIHNLYGNNQDGEVCNKYPIDKIIIIGFKKSAIDRCVFYQGCAIFECYAGDKKLLYLHN